jgi:hypothetical protein
VGEVSPALQRAAFERELKLALPEARASIARGMLDALCRPDPMYAAATVSTIYYDTPNLRLLAEKLDSDFLKAKVRLRWYGPVAGGASAGRAFLEVKTREGALRRKARLETPLDADWLDRANLSEPAVTGVVDLARTLGAELPERLVPALLIRYERRRYVEPASGARVSLDCAITVPRCNPALLRPGGPVRLGTCVLEVKGGGDDLPRALRPLAHVGARRASFSKYGEAGLALVRFRL